MNIIEKLGMTPGELKIRVKVDDSGDREYRTYDIMACYPWGANGLVYDMDNPNDARLFYTAPEMLEHLINECIRQERTGVVWISAIAIIEKATGKTWKEIKALL